MKLRVENLHKSFPGQDRHSELVALGGVNLDLDTGEFVSIVGPSGCGKSTLLGLVAGLSQPSTGRILLDGAQSESLLGRVGYMPQRDLLMPWRTVLDNVILGLEMAGVPRREARARASRELPRFGLAGFEKLWPGGLSAGMRQRAALLRTFLAGGELMLLDEPYGALDALTRKAMQEWLLEIWQADRKTILFVTHDVEEAIYLSDRVYVMSERPGRVQMCVEVGLPRPRDFQVTLSPEFVALKQRLLVPLRDASRRQLEVVAA
jgi:ABC-type nitrate/sulfonate/bicarbonate transport system ATPase subunit